MPYHQISWNSVTGVLTLTPTLAETYTITASVNFDSYPGVSVVGNVRVSVYGLDSAPCLLPTSGMNLLNTNAVAYQTSLIPGLNTNPNQACDGIQFDVLDSDLVTTDTTQP